ncbi:MAG: DNA mismatch repair protein MutS [Lachnospiraceae bacterium]|nr:DNA mismatch repair protein MutS [Lachnospiraceae bacterium]
MMQHYLETKKQNPDCLLFYRLGDFYELFFDDALLVSRELDLFLTGKDCGLEERAPMCGVPFHAADSYIDRLVEKGYKVAIAEQVEDPRTAKGLVKREVIRIVTPGTNVNSQSLEEGRNNYIMCIIYTDASYGMAVCDVSTGEFSCTQMSSAKLVYDEIDRCEPSEIVCNRALSISEVDTDGLRGRGITISEVPDLAYSSEESASALAEHFTGRDIGHDLAAFPDGHLACCALMWYLRDTQKTSLGHITDIRFYRTGMYMILDSFTRRNLELTETLREKEKKGSLAWVLDTTRTAMGSRHMRAVIEQPLIDIREIRMRQDAVETFVNDMELREELREYLGPIRDLERLLARITYGSVNPREMNSFAASLEMLPHIKNILVSVTDPLLRMLCDQLDTLEDITSLIKNAIADDPPLTVKEGGIIREGYSEAVDRYRKAKSDGKAWLAELESSERERTGIRTLRIKYNRIFGYCVEVTNSFKDQVPDDYVRRQTLTGAERYTFDRLKEMEETILGAEEKLFSLEYDLYSEVRTQAAAQVARIHASAEAIGMIDVLSSLADVAVRSRYVKPVISENGVIDIKGGRHPVVEEMLGGGLFVKNDTYLDGKDNLISVITGPNMAGKSTYMRQSALIVLMAQMGSFVPADEARICICDRIFTRVGASDDLSSGQSTFMVEMNEVANILRNATRRSLLILDEIGRGTSTFDGLSIAWSVIEYISRKLCAKTLFATHYHELTELEGALSGVQNYCIAVKEQGDDIIFLRRIIKGGADKSYGIQVARLAGVPDEVIQRAKEIAAELSGADIAARAGEVAQQALPPRSEGRKNDSGQLSLFGEDGYEDIISDIISADISSLSPIEAMNRLYGWQKALKNRRSMN